MTRALLSLALATRTDPRYWLTEADPALVATALDLLHRKDGT